MKQEEKIYYGVDRLLRGLSPFTNIKCHWRSLAWWKKNDYLHDAATKIAENEDYEEHVVHFMVKKKPERQFKNSPEIQKLIDEREAALEDIKKK